MTAWRRTLAAAQRRTAVQSAVSGAARALPIAAGAALCWVAVATAMEWLPRWPVVGGAVAATVAGAGLIGWLRRPSSLAVAVSLDRQAGIHDAIGTALLLSSRPQHGPMEAWAIDAADQAAAGANAARAFPWELRRPLIAAGLAAGMLVGAALLPARWTAKVAEVAGLSNTPKASKAEVETSLADAAAAEKLISAVQQAARPDEAKDPATAGVDRTDPLAELKQQLERGEIAPKEASQQAATAVERAADQLEQRAAETQQATDMLRERLAAKDAGPRDRTATSEKESALTRALREGDLSKAAAEAEKLAGGADKLSPQERAKLAEELKGVAEDLKPTSADTPRRNDDPASATAGQTRKEEAKPATTDPAGDSPERSDRARSEAEKQAKELADKVRQASEDLQRPDRPSDREAQAQPPQSREAKAQERTGDQTPASDRKDQQPKQPGEQGAKPQQSNGSQDQLKERPGDRSPSGANGDAGEKQQSSESKPGEQPQANDKPQPGGASQKDRAAGSPRPQPGEEPQPGEKARADRQAGSEEKAGENSRSSQQTPEPGEPRSSGQTPPGGRPQAEPSNDRSEKPDGAKHQAEGQQSSSEKPRPDQRQENDGRQGRPPAKPSPAAGKPEGSPTQQSPAKEGEQPGGPSSQQPTAGENSAREPRTDEQKGDGHRPGEAPASQQRPAPGQKREPGVEQHEEPGAKPQSGQEGDKPGSLPEKLPDQLPPLDQLRDQLKKLADKPREAAKDRQDAQKLREQAQKLWENATPEQRKQIEQMARELAKSRQPGANDEAGRGPQGPGKRPDRPDEPATGSGERELGGKGEGPGDGAPGVKTAARASDDPGKPHDIDARSSGDEQAPSRIIAEWLTNKPGPSKPGEPTAPQQVTDAVKQQQQAAEQALQQRTVPGRLGPLVRRYFDRLPGAVGAQPSNAEPKSQPAPKPAGQ